jgi:hypothetical protein
VLPFIAIPLASLKMRYNGIGQIFDFPHFRILNVGGYRVMQLHGFVVTLLARLKERY